MTTTTHNGSAISARVKKLETTVEEQAATIQRLAAAVATMLARQMQPQMEQAVLQQLLRQPDTAEAAEPVATGTMLP